MDNNEGIKFNNDELNNNGNNQKKNNVKTIILIVIAMILVLAIGLGGGFLLANKDKNDSNNNANTTQTPINKQEQTKADETVEESDIKKLFNQVNKDNFKKVEIGLLTDDYDYKTKEFADYQLAQKIIEASSNFKVEEVNVKSLPEMNYIIIYYNNSHITLHYYIDEDDITISSGEGDSYKCWRGSNNNLTNLRTIVNDYMKQEVKNTTVADNTNNKQESTTGTSKLKYENYPFYFYAPESWNCKIQKVENSQYKVHSDDEYYEIKGTVNGKEEIAFSIMITSDKSYDNSSWVNIGDCDNGKYIYEMQRFICRDNDGINHNSNDYKFENEVSEAMKTLKIKYKIVNEFGSGNETKVLEGRCFKRGQPGTSARSDIYYIKDGNLCRTSLTDGFETSILASNTKYIYLSDDGKIHAYPEGSSFMNNIAQDDENVVYENIN